MYTMVFLTKTEFIQFMSENVVELSNYCVEISFYFYFVYLFIDKSSRKLTDTAGARGSHSLS